MTLWPYARTEQAPSSASSDYLRDGEASAFVQWKGTDVCLDFACTCGNSFHLHGMFAYAIRCIECDAVWEMPATIIPRLCDGSEYPRDSPRFDGDDLDE